MTRFSFLSSTRLDLVLLQKDDAPQLLQWVNDSRITQYLKRGAYPLHLDAEEQWIESTNSRSDHQVFGLYQRSDETLIGTVGLHGIDHINQTAELGILIGDPSYWSNGYGSEAVQTVCSYGFTALNLRHITLRVLSNNPRGHACYTKCGFIAIGTIPEYIYKDGSWYDETIMLLKREAFTKTS